MSNTEPTFLSHNGDIRGDGLKINRSLSLADREGAEGCYWLNALDYSIVSEVRYAKIDVM